jgi:hypothetical protein
MAARKRRIRLVDSYDEQLLLWLNGTSVHLRSSRRGESFQCCPDFSCCNPALQQPTAVRRTFVHNPAKRDGMLMTFLGRMIGAATKAKVYVTDGKTRILTHARPRT